MIETCSMCGRERLDPVTSEPLWKTDLSMVTTGGLELDRFTVCPDCREQPLKDIFAQRIAGGL